MRGLSTATDFCPLFVLCFTLGIRLREPRQVQVNEFGKVRLGLFRLGLFRLVRFGLYYGMAKRIWPKNLKIFFTIKSNSRYYVLRSSSFILIFILIPVRRREPSGTCTQSPLVLKCSENAHITRPDSGKLNNTTVTTAAQQK